MSNTNENAGNKPSINNKKKKYYYKKKKTNKQLPKKTEEVKVGNNTYQVTTIDISSNVKSKGIDAEAELTKILNSEINKINVSVIQEQEVLAEKSFTSEVKKVQSEKQKQSNKSSIVVDSKMKLKEPSSSLNKESFDATVSRRRVVQQTEELPFGIYFDKPEESKSKKSFFKNMYLKMKSLIKKIKK